MAKKFQDIIPPERRSIRNIPLANRLDSDESYEKPTAIRKKTVIRKAPVVSEPSPKKIQKLLEIENGNGGRGKSMWAIAIVCIVILVFVVVSKFANATVSLVVSAKPIALSDSFVLSHNSSTTDAIDYDVITLSLSAPVPASALISTTTPVIIKKATGTVTITNNYSKSSQILVKNTRLESPDGKIFYLDNRVVVPGQKTSSTGLIVGTVSATITAEKGGQEYNYDSTSFTFPALKSSSKYQTITAKSKTAISGGLNSMGKPLVDKNALADIQKALEDKAVAQIYTQKSQDTEMFSGGIQDSIDVDASNTASLTITALLINKFDLATELNKQKNLGLNLLPDVTGNLIFGTSSVSVKLPTDIKLANLDSDGTFKIGLSGTTTITSDLSTDTLQHELAGLNQKTAETRLKDKIGVDAVLVEMWPWWVNTIPKEPSRINIKIENN
jgi:hypothetical protein